MSAWGIGRRGGTESLAAGQAPITAFVDRLVQWIPADVVAIYTVGITTLRTQHPDPNPSTVWLIIAGALAFILVLLAAKRTRKTVTGHDFALAVVAVIAFAIWSLAIPNSGWYHWSFVNHNPGWVALIAGLGGVLFAATADAFVGG